MATLRHGIFPATFDSLELTQLLDFAIRSGNTKAIITPGGMIDPKAVITAMADPEIALSTGNLGVLSSVSPTAGLAVTSAGTVRFQKRVDGGTFATSTAHVTVSSSKGFLYPTRLTAQQDDAAGARLELLYKPLSSSGLAVPLTVNTSVNFDSAEPPAFVNQYFLGPLYIGGSEVTGLTGVTIDFGINYQPIRAGGDVFAQEGSIIARNPSITVTLLKTAQLATQGLFGTAYTSTGVACYFVQGVHGSTRTAYASTAHVKIASVTGDMTADDVSVAGETDATISYMIRPSGATPTLAVSVGTAIP